jgi:hypothetical protein
MLPDIRMLLEVSQASPDCPSDRNNMWTKMCVEALLEIVSTGKIEVLIETPLPLPFCPPQIPHGLTWDRTRAFFARGQNLIA